MSNLEFELGPTQSDFVESDAHIVQCISPMGEGKSESPENQLLMADGTIKKAKDIRPGDFLMGDDSKPRQVLTTSTGIDEMVEVVPTKGDSFVVNKPHILCLKRTHCGTKKDGRIFHVSVEDFIEKSRTFRNTHHLYRVPVSFPFRRIDIDPYFLGLWLGDGTALNTSITSPEIEVKEFLRDYAGFLGLDFSIAKRSNSGKANLYKITRGKTLRNPLLGMMRDHDLINNKHIPYRYKCNSRAVRMEVLAGVLDSDGWVNHGGYQIIQKERRLAEDIAYLARSLGFFASLKVRKKKSNFLDKPGYYHHVMISGDCSQIPVRVKRKKVEKRKQKKDPLVTCIKEIKSLGRGKYCGFTLDGNGRYLHSDFLVTHNTFAGVVGLIRHAARCGKDIRAALIRDTFQNIKTSTKPDIEDYLELGKWVEFKDSGRQMVIHSNPRVHCDLFGIDDEASISKLQGPQYAIIWLEEPAPIYEKANAGLPIGVFNMAIARAARQRNTRMRVQLTHNPSDEDHWTALLAEEPYEYVTVQDPASGEWITIHKDTFRIPRGENKYLNPLARAATVAAFKGDKAKYQRYVLGEEAELIKGKRVTAGYNSKIHFSPIILPVLKGPAIQFWDSWLNPTCIIAQYTMDMQLIIHDVCYGDGIGVEELIEERVEPLLQTPKYKGKIKGWRAIGDASMKNPDQSTSRNSAARVVEKAFKCRFEPGPAHWTTIRQPLNRCFKRLLNEGKPVVKLSRSATRLNRALKGGWHYKVDVNGNVIGDKPQKNTHSHPGDAFANGIAVLMPYDPRKEYREAKKKRSKIANSYRGGNFSRRGTPGVVSLPI